MVACLEEIAYRMGYITAARARRGWRARWSRARTASTCSACSSTRPDVRVVPTELPGVSGRSSPTCTATAAGSSSRPITPSRYRAARHRRRRSCRTTTRGRSAARCAACTCRCAGRRASWCASSRARSSTSPSTSGAARRPSGAGSAVTLSADNFRQCYIPPGFAHGFCVAQPDRAGRVQVHRLLRSGGEIGIAWNDPALAIAWPVREPLLSPRDLRHPTLAEVTAELPSVQ